MTALVSRPCFHHWHFFLGVSRHRCLFVFFVVVCVFSCSTCLHLAQSNWQVLFISAPVGSQQNKQTWPPEPSICRCAPSHSQIDLCCLPPTVSGSEPHRVHVTLVHTVAHAQATHTQTLTVKAQRHNRDKYVSASGLGCDHPY